MNEWMEVGDVCSCGLRGVVYTTCVGYMANSPFLRVNRACRIPHPSPLWARCRCQRSRVASGESGPRAPPLPPPRAQMRQRVERWVIQELRLWEGLVMSPQLRVLYDMRVKENWRGVF